MSALPLSLDAPIVPPEGIEGVRLGMSAAELLPRILASPYADIEVRGFYPNLLRYTYKKCLKLTFDIKSGRLVQVDVSEGYLGKIQGRIGIGSTVREARELYSELYFDEQYILVGKDWNPIFRLQDDIESIESALGERIEAITMEVPGRSL